MSLHLSSQDVARFRTLLGTLLSPPETSGLDLWRAQVCQESRELLGADSASFGLFTKDIASIFGDCDPDAPRAYLEYFATIDEGLDRRNALGYEVVNWRLIFPDGGRPANDELYNDFFVAHHLIDPHGMTVDLPGGATASISVHSDTPCRRPTGARWLHLLELVLPAFKAGVAMYLQAGTRLNTLAAMLDQVSDPLLLADLAGEVLHANAALVQLLGADPERQRLRTEIEEVTRFLSSLERRPTKAESSQTTLSALRKVQTARNTYEVRGSYAGTGLIGNDRAILVLVDPLTPEMPSEQDLRHRFGLTKREAEITLLLAAGRSAAQIAEQLHISLHTARRHVEKILSKLGIHSRAEVGPTILRRRS